MTREIVRVTNARICKSLLPSLSAADLLADRMRIAAFDELPRVPE